MLARLALLFIVVPLVELALLIELGQWIGLWPTVALVFVTGVAGAALARKEGLRVLYRVQGELGAGRIPGRALLDAFSVLVGGAFLLTPGVLTDVLGFSLLLPFSRRWIQSAVRRRFQKAVEEGRVRVGVYGTWTQGGSPPGRPDGSAAEGPAVSTGGEVGRAEIRTPSRDDSV